MCEAARVLRRFRSHDRLRDRKYRSFRKSHYEARGKQRQKRIGQTGSYRAEREDHYRADQERFAILKIVRKRADGIAGDCPGQRQAAREGTQLGVIQMELRHEKWSQKIQRQTVEKYEAKRGSHQDDNEIFITKDAILVHDPSLLFLVPVVSWRALCSLR